MTFVGDLERFFATQLVRDRWAAEGLGDHKVVALRPHQSEGATVTKRRRRQGDLAR